tara:strand:- start:353 stop:538 length:186 start_codon:yes stop_codon:yes gene_type:complete
MLSDIKKALMVKGISTYKLCALDVAKLALKHGVETPAPNEAEKYLPTLTTKTSLNNPTNYK